MREICQSGSEGGGAANPAFPTSMSKACALCQAGSFGSIIPLSSPQPTSGLGTRRHLPWVASEGNDLAHFLSRHQHLSRKARWASLQNTVGVPDQKTCRRIG